MKCELEFWNYSFLRLTDPNQLIHHTGPAFQVFLELAQRPDAYEVRVVGRPIVIDGAILVWGATSEKGRKAVMTGYSFADVLSIEKMAGDLRSWGVREWASRVDELRDWTAHLYDYLSPTAVKPGG